MSTCMNLCLDPFPGESAWICELDENHYGLPHREGNVMWSSGGSQVADHHNATSGE